MKHARPFVCVVLTGMSGCGERGAEPAAPAPASKPAAAAPNLDLQPTYPEPEYTLAIEKSESDPPQYSVVWTATVNTGGWKLTTESVLVEDSMGKTAARVWIVVHEPQPGDVVTQAVTTLTGRHDAGTTKIEKAELSAKHTVRDSKPTYPQLYSVVKEIGG